MPFPFRTTLSQPALERTSGGATLFFAPAGYLFTDHLAAVLQENQAPLLWLRAGPEDRDPAMLLASLVTGLAESFPAVAEHTLSQIRRLPGALYGWGSLFSGLARDIADASQSVSGPRRDAPQTAGMNIVIEHIDQLSPAPQTLELLCEHFLPLLPPGSTRVLTTHTSLPRGRLPGYIRQANARELFADEHYCLSLARESCTRLPARILRRMTRLAEGREVVLNGLFSSCQVLSSQAISDTVDSAENFHDLLNQLARCCLDASSPGTTDQLALALQLEYLHPTMVEAVLGQAASQPELFLQALSGGWARLRCVWQAPLRTVIRPGETQGRAAIERAAHFLIQQGAYERAIPLLLDLDEPREAARVIVQVVEPLMDLGQWETLASWINRLPEPVQKEWPWLVYTRGELAAARGQARAARRIFASATRLFQERRDMRGACQSLLTESCLSAWEDDQPQAEEYALQARALAENNGLPWYQGWANWQLGSLSETAGRPSEAMAYFTGAGLSASTSGDIQMAAFVEQARLLAQASIDHQQKKAQYVQAYYEADQAEREATAQLHFLLENPSGQGHELRSLYGWSRTPLFLKLPPPREAASATPAPERLWNFFKGLVRSGREAAYQPAFQTLEPSAEPAVVILPGGAGTAGDPAENGAALLPVTGDGHARPAIPEEPPADGKITRLPSAAAQNPVPRTPGTYYLNAYILGNFRVMINENGIDTLPSGRGRAVFAYLLCQAARPVARDVIMDAFWPDASAESARNSLNVAIYSLRQALKPVIDIPVVLFQENTYLLNPQIVTWLDLAAFEQSVQGGREYEAKGKLVEATRSYEHALSLYQGDLLSEFPYEDWVAIERERLRVLYLETLDRLSMIYFSQGQYAACVALCQRMLTHDASREDAHCRLMRCYARQGQNHLALRQYQVCVEALQTELDVKPAPATIQLYEQVRRREVI